MGTLIGAAMGITIIVLIDTTINLVEKSNKKEKA